MARKRQVPKGFRRGERKRAPRELTARIQEERKPVTVRKASPEEIARIREMGRNGSPDGRASA